ncbi:MAG: PilZ domain-containing protein [Idiomarina sp.]|nr:PilZ domain-containing protein [Idiomarina sp.]
MTGFSLATAMKSISVDIEIRMGTHKHRIRGLWVGQREGDYLIIDLPRKYNWLELQEWFQNCTGVVLRGVLREGQVFAAATRYIGLSSRPFRQLYVSAPDKFEERSLRKVPRIQVDIEATLSFAEEVPAPEGVPESFTSVSGRVTDLSRTGIAFETEAELPFDRDLFMDRLIDLSLYDNGEEIAKVIGEAKSCRLVSEGLVQFGLAIDSRNRDYQESLGQLILSSKHVQAVLRGE